MEPEQQTHQENNNTIEIENPKQNNSKIILITIRNPQNSEYRPAEEIFFRIIANKMNFNYEIITYDSHRLSPLFGKLPCIYYDKRLIRSHNIFGFFKDLIVNEQDIVFNEFFENLLFILRNKFDTFNKYEYYKENLKKYSKRKNAETIYKKFLSFNHFYEKFTDFILSGINRNESIFSILKDIDKLKDKYQKEELKDFIVKLTIFSFLKEDRKLYNTNIIRPYLNEISIEDENILKSLGNFFNTFNDFINNPNFFIQIENEKIEKALLKHKMKLNEETSNAEPVQVIQVKNSILYNLFSLTIFVGFGVIFYFMARKK